MKHTTLKVLVDQFDAFFIDQFGVLMDANWALPFCDRLNQKGFLKRVYHIQDSDTSDDLNCFATE